MIIHIDMDAFYAAVEQRDDPSLRGKPVLVGGRSGRGVVCAASYEARAFGCHSAMPMRLALAKCSQAIVRPPRFDVYRQVAQKIRDIFLTATPLVEPLSLDEAFLDVTASQTTLGPAEEIGHALKRRIHESTELVASVGIAPVKFVAKIASDLGKPNGFVVVHAEDILGFLGPLPVEKLWGVGRATLPRLHAMKMSTIDDIRRIAPHRLRAELGKLGQHLWDLAHGRDDRPVVPDRDPKSISQERTFDEDLLDSQAMLRELHGMVDSVAGRLRKRGLDAGEVFIKVRFTDFRTMTRQRRLAVRSSQTAVLWAAIRQLWLDTKEAHHKPIRLLGAGVSSLELPRIVQPGLFDDPETPPCQVDPVIDEIRHRFGESALRSADTISKPNRP